LNISQGKLSELTFDVPAGLSITQVRGEHIRDWKLIAGAAAGAPQQLSVQLNQPQTQRYDLQILGETALPKFPATVALPTPALPATPPPRDPPPRAAQADPRRPQGRPRADPHPPPPLPPPGSAPRSPRPPPPPPARSTTASRRAATHSAWRSTTSFPPTTRA